MVLAFVRLHRDSQLNRDRDGETHALPPHRPPPSAIPHPHPRHAQHGFEAFTPHHGPTAASSSSSWRTHAPTAPAPVKEQAPIPIKERRSASPHYTHSRSPSSSSLSDASTASWRDRSTAPSTAASSIPASPEKRVAELSHFTTVARAQADVVKTSPTPARTRVGPAVYQVTDLLRLASSPLVGVTEAAHAVLEEHVSHQVWRRGRDFKISRPNDGGRPKRRAQRSTAPSTDSESN
ncbi:hypothetical protein EVG20_g8167 [Dentipellis fragilis]|uniref:Uncharacterized protein n=1 Tax=Dentipellis fragilis TaxID=205917 RepID=A0A4Y9YAA9_9AGAM|nr:hypothetical protein EVG20_g8167 [Dentipellis fragilis]